MTDLKSQFEAAVQLVRTAEGKFQPSNDLKLEMYSLFKQATEGDVKGSRPGMLNFVERAKYDAWAKVKGMSKDSAMQAYVAKVEGIKKQFS